MTGLPTHFGDLMLSNNLYVRTSDGGIPPRGDMGEVRIALYQYLTEHYLGDRDARWSNPGFLLDCARLEYATYAPSPFANVGMHMSYTPGRDVQRIIENAGLLAEHKYLTQPQIKAKRTPYGRSARKSAMAPGYEDAE